MLSKMTIFNISDYVEMLGFLRSIKTMIRKKKYLVDTEGHEFKS
jgi:hypothetical protein